ncbi:MULTISPECIES: hypothetical protein [unclassified Bradyrhizobium]|uniref:hypothetical protein n=1 Tax=unclassified Bradyrhizobium TaxID=2631580 RepID=UPI001FFBA53B|nr:MULTISPECIES: hypothetical protein [unclassified Bradyrhizobium]MCK1420919.1 hypothetical protein [Bradyrhizobium sp. CW12]MCK1647411.1 hypothetical protein [Bradyrhizobium sp. 154]
MPVLADERLAALVRQVMPARAPQWVVQIVDDHQDACVMFNRSVLRVHRNWSTDVHDAGLHSVLAYHPLGLKKVSSQVLRGLSSRTAVDVWQACAIKKGYKGRLSEKRGFLARTADGELAFASNAAAAELDALREVKRAIYERARQARSRAQRDREYQRLMSRRLTLRKYDGSFRVPLSDYEGWLPKQTAEALRHYDDEGVPLLVIEGEAFDLVPSLNDGDLADLVYQLDRDVQRAQAETDDRALDQFLGSLDEG